MAHEKIKTKRRKIMANQKNKMSLAKKMAISLVCGLVAGIAMLMLRENLTANGNEATWAMINSLLFADITAAGNESALGLFYLIGQMFVRALQLVIVPMVFTSITLAVGKITDTKQLGRISVKTIGGFLACSFFALLLACVAGHLAYRAGMFSLAETGLEGAAGSTGSNPLGVVLNAVPSNIISTFSSNSAVLAIVVLNEEISKEFVIGAIIICIGILLAVLRSCCCPGGSCYCFYPLIGTVCLLHINAVFRSTCYFIP